MGGARAYGSSYTYVTMRTLHARTLQGELCAYNTMMVLASLSLNFCFRLHKHSSILAHRLEIAMSACTVWQPFLSPPNKSFLVMKHLVDITFLVNMSNKYLKTKRNSGVTFCPCWVRQFPDVRHILGERPGGRKGAAGGSR